jgi:hypothetical protein
VPWWQHASPSRAVVATRIPIAGRGGSAHPHLARIGVGAVQNRRPDHRVISTVCGDAGRPAHQRPETPRCARRRSASIPTPMHDHDRRSPPRWRHIADHPCRPPRGFDGRWASAWTPIVAPGSDAQRDDIARRVRGHARVAICVRWWPLT